MPQGDGRADASNAVSLAEEAGGAAPLYLTPRNFYRTAAMPCPYVDGRAERKLVTELAGSSAVAFYNGLSRAGFRRSHHLAYRPACNGCSACVPVRIPVADFHEPRWIRRIRNANRDLGPRLVAPVATFEQYRLFETYQHSRHADSDMAAMNQADYRAMIEDSPLATRLVELRDEEGDLYGACLVDVLDDGLSAVYSFFAPEESRRSLGSALVLSLVDEARRRRLPYVYLGYWIRESPKMAYKARFRPLEELTAQGWVPLAV